MVPIIHGTVPVFADEDIVAPFGNCHWIGGPWNAIHICSYLQNLADRDELVHTRIVVIADSKNVGLWFRAVVSLHEYFKRTGQRSSQTCLKRDDSFLRSSTPIAKLNLH